VFEKLQWNVVAQFFFVVEDLMICACVRINILVACKE